MKKLLLSSVVFIAALAILISACTNQQSALNNLRIKYFTLNLTHLTLTAVSCSSNDFCLAAGEDLNSQDKNTNLHTIVFNIASKSEVNLQAFSTQSVIVTVSCITNTKICLLGGQNLANDTPALFITQNKGLTYTNIDLGSTIGQIESISCISQTDCLLAGFFGQPSTPKPFLILFDPSSSSITQKEINLVGVLNSVSCNQLNCVSFGSFYTKGGISQNFEVLCREVGFSLNKLNGCKISNNLNIKDDTIVSSFCNHLKCWATGLKFNHYNSLGEAMGPPAIFESTNTGSNWVTIKTDGTQYGLMTSISCNKNYCLSVGSSGVLPKLNGWLNIISSSASSNSQIKTIMINPNALLYSISCTSVACLSVGELKSSKGTKALVVLVSGL